MGLSNDERGWVMTSLSGAACVLGAAIICVDIIIRQFPGKRDFRIQDSDAFLSSSLSLSFGVMLFSALFSMLPSSKQSLRDAGFSPKVASWIMISCFIAGVLGIQVISRILHRYIPSHVVDCEHTHAEDDVKESGSATAVNQTNTHDSASTNEHSHTHSPVRPKRIKPRRQSSLLGHIPSTASPPPAKRGHLGRSADNNDIAIEISSPEVLRPTTADRRTTRPSLGQRLSTTFSQLTSRSDATCGKDCYGYTAPCGPGCFKNLNAKGAHRHHSTDRPSMAWKSRNSTTNENTPLLQDVTEESTHVRSEDRLLTETSEGGNHNHNHHDAEQSDHSSTTLQASGMDDLHRIENGESRQAGHHHHVPTNAFLSIGLQTSIAIALHKLPEGFITYATNHANPKLGVAVFLALFIHNITEGFAMALPLYLAIQSRIKAMLISFALGGLSQPLGAGIAALWFKIAGKGDWAPSDGVYGGMFAVTAGIMASVALQLFSEALDLTHSRSLCMIGAFAGMAILGISSALTAS